VSPEEKEEEPTPALARDVFEQVADRRVIDPLFARETARVAREHDLPIRLREPRTHLDPAEWRAGYLAVHERELPPQLLEDLKQLSPQALLRDLYRPVWKPEPVVLELQEELRLDFGARRASAEARSARSREPLPRVEPGAAVMVEEQARRRQVLAEPWQAQLPDDAPRKPIFTGRGFDPEEF